MKKLLVIAMVMVCGFLSSAQAQLPGNPANPHGTLIDRPGVALAKWERVGYNVYWEFTLTTSNTFIPPPGIWDRAYVEFWASNMKTSPAIMFPGSMNIIFDEWNYPYGSRYYSGVIDLSDYEEGWTTLQADFNFFTGDPNNPDEVGDTNFIDTPADFGFPDPSLLTKKTIQKQLSNK